jgi:hypothetical protein
LEILKLGASMILRRALGLLADDSQPGLPFNANADTYFDLFFATLRSRTDSIQFFKATRGMK